MGTSESQAITDEYWRFNKPFFAGRSITQYLDITSISCSVAEISTSYPDEKRRSKPSTWAAPEEPKHISGRLKDVPRKLNLSGMEVKK